MLNVSEQWKNQIYNKPVILVKAEVDLLTGEKLYLDYEDSDDDFMASGIALQDSTTSDSSFNLGTAVMNVFSFSLNNMDGRYSDTIFSGATITPYFGFELDNGEVEWVKKGVFNISSNNNNNLPKIDFQAYDNMSKLELPFSAVKITYPITLGNMAKAICDYCGVELETTTFDNSSYSIKTAPIGTDYSCRKMISCIAQISGGFARFNAEGKLEIKWYSDDINHEIPVYKDVRAESKDVTITGIQVSSYYNEDALSEENAKNTETSLTGVDGFVITISENPLIPYGSANTVSTYLGNKLNGTKFRPIELDTFYDPSLEAGDKVKIKDVRNNEYIFFVTNLTANIGGGANISCVAETDRENTANQYSNSSSAIVKILDVVNAKIQNLVTSHLDAEIAKIGYLKAEKADIDYLKVGELDAVKAEIEDAIIKNLDAEFATIENLNATKATIENLQATVATIDKAYVDEATVNTLIAGKGFITALEADTLIAKKGYLTEAEVDTLVVGKGYLDEAEVNTLIVSKGYFTEAQVETLVANKGYITTVATEELLADYATITSLNATNASINDLIAIAITTENLSAKVATLGYAKITDLDAVNANISSLDAEVADINTLIFGSASGTSIHTSFANAVIAQLGNAQIKSAMIENVSADKITAGDIITNNVRVMSEDGKLLISDETIQISDATRVRVQIGKDSAGDYSINIWDADGNLMFSEGGITDKAIKEAIIRNDMVTDDANISASKLDIDSLFTEINNSSKTIKSTKIYLDDKKQTLDVAFTAVTSDVSELSNDVSSQGTAISVIQGQISSKVWQEDIDTATNELDGEISTLSTQYTHLNQTVNDLNATVASHTTEIANKADGSTVTAISSKVSDLELSLDGFKTTVSATYTAKDSFDDLTSRVSTAESSITQNASDIALKVSENGVISAINQTAETVKINASKIELTGAVTFSTFSSDLQSKINGIDSDASDALTKADAAKDAADSANSVIADWCYNNNKTYIDGANIYTGTIKAKQIDVNDLFAQEITATGTIRSSNMQIIGGYIQIEAAAKESSIIKISNGSTFTEVTASWFAVETSGADGTFDSALYAEGLACNAGNYSMWFGANEGYAVVAKNNSLGTELHIGCDSIEYWKADDTVSYIYYDDIASMAWVEEQIILAIYSSWEASY